MNNTFPALRTSHLAPLFILLLLMFFHAVPARGEALGGCFGKIRSIAGDVRVQLRADADWQPATIDSCLYEEYGLKTGKDSGVLVVLDDLSEIRLSENTYVHFNAMRYRFLLTRLAGIGLHTGEIFMDITEGYDEIFVQSDSSAAKVTGASVDIMLLPENEDDPKSLTGTSVFVLTGAVDVFDVFLQYRVTVGPEEQTNVSRHRPPQAVYFYNDKTLKPYVKAWRDRLQPGRKLNHLYSDEDISELRRRTLACPSDFYKAGLWCCPNACANGPSSLPQDIYCPDGTYYIGARHCCDNECSRK